jgi:signal transduction histidine kinase
VEFRDPTAQGRAVLQVAQSVLADLDVESVLTRVLEAAVELTGARYAAVGVLDDSRSGLARFITVGLSDDERAAIGPLPRGRGVLGELIAHPQPLRLADVGRHARSYGFPSAHPPMRTFLGVPVLVGGVPYGNLYLTEKAGGGDFTEDDEDAVGVLAQFAGLALDHAQQYAGVDARRGDLERTVAALDASIQITRALGAETELASVLELVAKRGRALVDARALVIESLEGDELVMSAAAGEIPNDLVGMRVALADTVACEALQTRRSQRLEDEANRVRFELYGLGRRGVNARFGLVAPLVFRGHGYGVLVAVDRLEGSAPYSAEETQLLESFAASAATAIATARSVTEERQRQRLAAAEDERRRWARELHDETLQEMASLKILLASGMRSDDIDEIRRTVGVAVEQVQAGITSLRSLITDLRPAALDDLGAEAAIETLARRSAAQGLDVEIEIDLSYEKGREPTRHVPDMESAIYRIVQESLTNARKHGHADHATVVIRETDSTVEITVTDNGSGFQPNGAVSGFGLLGMRERVDLLGGRFELESSPGQGTTVHASLLVTDRAPAAATA